MKKISRGKREAIVAAHQSGKSHKIISKQFGVQFCSKRDYSQVQKHSRLLLSLPKTRLLSKFTLRSDGVALRDVGKKNTEEQLQQQENHDESGGIC